MEANIKYMLKVWGHSGRNKAPKKKKLYGVLQVILLLLFWGKAVESFLV